MGFIRSCCSSCQSSIHPFFFFSCIRGRVTYPSVFVASLLVLLGHSPGVRLREQVNTIEHSNRGKHKLGHLGQYPQAFSLGSLGARAVRTESNPVGCYLSWSVISIPTSIHSLLFIQIKTLPPERGIRIPAFFSWAVIWCQSTFIRSRSCIHRSACS